MADGASRDIEMRIRIANDPSVRRELENTGQMVDKFVRTTERAITDALGKVTKAAGDMAGRVESAFKRMEAQAVRSGAVIGSVLTKIEQRTGGGGLALPGAGGAGRVGPAGGRPTGPRKTTASMGGAVAFLGMAAGAVANFGRAAAPYVPGAAAGIGAYFGAGGGGGGGGAPAYDPGGGSFGEAYAHGRNTGLGPVESFVQGVGTSIGVWWNTPSADERNRADAATANRLALSRRAAAYDELVRDRDQRLADVGRQFADKRRSNAMSAALSEADAIAAQKGGVAGAIAGNDFARGRAHELGDMQALVRLEQERAQLVRQQAQEGIAGAQKRLQLAQQEKAEIERNLKSRERSLDSAAERFLDADPIERQKAIQAAMKAQGGGQLTKADRQALSGMGLLDAFPELGNAVTADVRRQAFGQGFHGLAERFGVADEFDAAGARLNDLNLKLETENRIIVELGQNSEQQIQEISALVRQIVKDNEAKQARALGIDELRLRQDINEQFNRAAGKIGG